MVASTNGRKVLTYENIDRRTGDIRDYRFVKVRTNILYTFTLDRARPAVKTKARHTLYTVQAIVVRLGSRGTRADPLLSGPQTIRIGRIDSLLILFYFFFLYFPRRNRQCAVRSRWCIFADFIYERVFVTTPPYGNRWGPRVGSRPSGFYRLPVVPTSVPTRHSTRARITVGVRVPRPATATNSYNVVQARDR